MNPEAILKNLYYNISSPTSYRGVNQLFLVAKEILPNLRKDQVRNWLRKQKTYSIHYPIKSNFKRNPIISKFIDHNWHGDLIEIPFSTYNHNFRYILMVIDNLSKFGWAEPLKDKKAQTVKKAFIKILRTSKRKPIILTTDAGKEFTNQSLKKYLRWRKIKHLVARDFSKAAVVERWNRTIKEKVFKYLTKNKTKNFIDVLPEIISGYNNTIHSRTKYKPIDVNRSNEKIIYRNLFKKTTIQEKQLFKIGDRVRLQLIRGDFDKGYLPNYTDEIFRIHKVLYTSPYYKYKVKDKKANIIRGAYYGSELLKVE